MATVRDKYAENTRRALLDTGRQLFATRDFASLSAEELVRTAGLTRGALYHHFDGKKGLFETVFEEREEQAALRIKAAITAGADPFERIGNGVAEYLDICAEPDYRHIVLLQGPLALGWQTWREIDQRHLGGLVVDAVRELLQAKLIQPFPTEMVAAAFYGALTELSFTVAEADDQSTARAEATRLVGELIRGLAVQRSS